MKTRIMLDLETLGQKPGSVIVALGAVKFGDGQITDTFYRRIEPESCVSLGMRMDTATVLWWLKQEAEARLEITKPGLHISDVLASFSAWVADPDAEIWGNGAGLDNVLLGEAYDKAGHIRPWKFWNDRCYRTVKSMYPGVAMPRTGTHHNALDDARSQALHLMAMLAPSFAPFPSVQKAP